MPSEDYVKGRTLGEGTWGRVYEANRKSDNLIVAVKRIKQILEGRNDGVSFSALREVKYLRELRHRNIIEVFFYYSIPLNNLRPSAVDRCLFL